MRPKHQSLSIFTFNLQQNSKGSYGATSSTSTVTSGETSRNRNISSPTRAEPDSPPPNKSPRHSPPDSPKPSRSNSPKVTSSDLNIIASSSVVTVSSNQSKSPTYVNSAPKSCYSESTSSRYTDYGPGDYGSSAFGKCSKCYIIFLETKNPGEILNFAKVPILNFYCLRKFVPWRMPRCYISCRIRGPALKVFYKRKIF